MKIERKGTSVGFHVYSNVNEQGTLGNPEEIVWSSIRHLCSKSVADDVAASAHGIARKRDRAAVVRNLKLYLQQASEFYDAAKEAKARTAPLIYYYSFLNLAKAFCEFKHPEFQNRKECYSHGISWRSRPSIFVNPQTEKVNLRGRGVWHALWESLAGSSFPAGPPISLKIKDLFSYCPEIAVEVEKSFGVMTKLVEIVDPDVLFDDRKNEAWIRFSINRWRLGYDKVSAAMLKEQISTPRTSYTEIKSADRNVRSFETTQPIQVTTEEKALAALRGDILGFNAFVNLDKGGRLSYSIPLQSRLPIRLHQMMVLYTLLFWLGSLVRYDPHSVDYLLDSTYWYPINGFMSQSRLWLLELFEWALYQSETTLWQVR